jgi:hypothetical protein
MDIVTVLGTFGYFCVLDRVLELLQVEGRYYVLHALHNAAITVLTAPNVYQSLFSDPTCFATPIIASQLIIALHAYHCWMYFEKLRIDDWIHHALMIGVALPLGLSVPSGSLMGMSLFFTTGLPGGIDYVLLALVRNGRLASDVEKRANAAIQVWVRSPGCVAVAALIVRQVFTHPDATEFYKAAALLTAVLNYWNGQYFAAQVVYDVGRRQLQG